MAKVTIEINDKPDGTVDVRFRPSVGEVQKALERSDSVPPSYIYALEAAGVLVLMNRKAQEKKTGIIASPYL